MRSLIGITLVAVLALLAYLAFARSSAHTVRRRPMRPLNPVTTRAQPKPPWVPKRIIRLKALMPYASCRFLALTFNRKHGPQGMTVGKTYVAGVVKHNLFRIQVLHRYIKNRVTRQGPRNHTWATDITFLPESRIPVLGLLDHGTRATLTLRAMSRRTTIALIRAFCDAFEKYGYPRFVRTDNEAPFASSVLTAFLWAFGIRHQRIDPHCPWQNGRIERSFWTLKQNLIAWWKEAGVPEDPQPDLDLLRTWVNHVRPHQGLAGLSPAEAWDPQILRRPLRYFSAWNGLLSGYGRPV